MLEKSSLLKKLEEISRFKSGDADDDRGIQIFGKVDEIQEYYSNMFFRLTLEMMQNLGALCPRNAEKKPTNFALFYENLVKNKVHFPQEQVFFLKPSTSSKSQTSSKAPDLENKKGMESSVKEAEDILTMTSKKSPNYDHANRESEAKMTK